MFYQELNVTSNHASTNTSNNTATHVVVDEAQKIAELVILPIILTSCLFGNILLISSILKFKKFWTGINLMILNLAICDVMTAFFSIPFTLIDRQSMNYSFGHVGCKVIWPSATYGNNASVFTLVLIAAERYLAIAKRFPMTKRRILSLIIFVHVLAIASIIPYSYHLKYECIEGVFYCYERWHGSIGQKFYTVALFLLQYGLPLPAMVVLYSLSWRQIKNQNNRTILMSEDYEMKMEWDEQSKTCVENTSNLSVFRDTSLLDLVNATNDPSTYSPRLHCNGFLSPSVKKSTGFKTKGFSPLLGEHRNASSSSLPPENINNNNHVTSIPRSATFEKIRTFGRKISTFRRPEFKSEVSHVRHRQTIKTLKMFVVIVTVFAIFALPNQITWLLRDFAPKENQPPLSIRLLFTVFSYTNSMINCWIYGGFSKHYRQAYKKIILSILKCCQHNVTFKSHATSKKLAPPSFDMHQDVIKHRQIVFTDMFEQHTNHSENFQHLYEENGSENAFVL